MPFGSKRSRLKGLYTTSDSLKLYKYFSGLFSLRALMIKKPLPAPGLGFEAEVYK